MEGEIVLTNFVKLIESCSMFCQSLEPNGQFRKPYLEVVWFLLRYIRFSTEANWEFAMSH